MCQYLHEYCDPSMVSTGIWDSWCPHHSHWPRFGFFAGTCPGQPRHVEGEVVDAAQKDVRGDPAAAKRVKEMFGPGFDDRQVADGIERIVLHGTDPAFMRGAR